MLVYRLEEDRLGRAQAPVVFAKMERGLREGIPSSNRTSCGTGTDVPPVTINIGHSLQDGTLFALLSRAARLWRNNKELLP